MRRLSASVAAILATFAAGAQDIPFVPGQGTSEQLTEQERDVARLAIDALAADLQIAKEGILVDTIRAVDWPDSSLRVPAAGTSISRRHHARAQGHAARRTARSTSSMKRSRTRFVCQKTEALCRRRRRNGELVFGPQMLEAQQDLANRLGVLESEIKPVSARAAKPGTTPRSAVPSRASTYPPGKVTGWVLTLRHGKREYTYHTDMSHDSLPCNRRAVSRWQ